MSSGAQPLVVLAGGKSGGHVFPAFAVAQELESLGATVVLFGRADSLEARLAKERGVRFQSIGAAALVGRGILGKLMAIGTLLVNGWRARGLLRRLDTAAVLGTGGFVSAPTVVGARLAGLPIVLLEPNASPGAANRLLSRFARLAAVADEKTGDQLRCPVLVTGVPVRTEFFEVPELSASKPNASPLRLLILGGSQGAESLNLALPGVLTKHLERGLVVHQCGGNHVDAAAKNWIEEFGEAAVVHRSANRVELRRAELSVEILPFINDMPGALASADLVISRAGAITLAELSAAGRGSILVPLPIAGAHQRINAERQAELGAALVIDQGELDRVGPLLEELIARPERLLNMGSAARSTARRCAARSIAEATRGAAIETGRWAA